MEARRRVGYMSQAFSLLGELSVRGNLQLHAKLFDLPVSERSLRVEEMLDRFGLLEVADAGGKGVRAAGADPWRPRLRPALGLRAAGSGGDPARPGASHLRHPQSRAPDVRGRLRHLVRRRHSSSRLRP